LSAFLLTFHVPGPDGFRLFQFKLSRHLISWGDDCLIKHIEKALSRIMLERIENADPLE
jgi:hypothetical protein